MHTSSFKVIPYKTFETNWTNEITWISILFHNGIGSHSDAITHQKWTKRRKKEKTTKTNPKNRETIQGNVKDAMSCHLHLTNASIERINGTQWIRVAISSEFNVCDLCEAAMAMMMMMIICMCTCVFCALPYFIYTLVCSLGVRIMVNVSFGCVYDYMTYDVSRECEFISMRCNMIMMN